MEDRCRRKVLLIEDDEEDYVLTRELLSEAERVRFDLAWVTTYEGALEALEQDDVDVVLVDYLLGAENGLDLVREAVARGCNAPFILLTGQGSYELDIAAMGAGVADYLVKGEVNAPLLERSIRHAIEQRRAEERATHLNAVLRAVRNVNQLIVREKDRGRLLQGVCDNLIESRGYYNAWIILMDEDGKPSTVAEFGVGEGFAALVERLERGETTHCVRTAVAQEGVVVIEDPFSACTDCPLSSGYGGRGGLATRLEYAGKVFGLMTISISRDLAIDEEEQSLFEEVAGDIAFALYGLEQEKKHERAEARLRTEKEFTDTALDAQSDTFFLFEPATAKVLRWNRAFRDLSGYTDEEIARMPAPASYYSPEDLERAGAFIQKVLEEGTGTIQLELVCKDGRKVPTEYRVSVINDDQGEPKYFISIGRDITERVRSEQEQAQAEEVLRAALEESRQRMAEIEELLEGARAVLECREFSVAARAIFDICKRLLGATAGYVALLSEDGSENQVLFLDAGGLPCTVDPGLPMPIRGLREEACKIGRAAYDNGFSSSPWMALMPDGHAPLENVLFAPLALEGKAVGLLGLANKPGGFSENDGRMAMAFGELASVALSNGRTLKSLAASERAVREHAERLRALRAIDGAILAAWSAEEVAQAALRHIQRLVPCQRASVMAFDLEANEATVLALHTDGEPVLGAGTRVSIDMIDLVGDLAQGKVHVIEDILARPQPTPVEQALQSAGTRTYVNVPLIASGNLIGSLNLGAESPGGLAPKHVDVAREVADQLAVAIQQVRLREQVQRHADELEERVAERTGALGRRTVQWQVAAEVARDATTARSLSDLLDRAVNLIRDRFGFDHAGIFLLDVQGAYAVLQAATGEAGQQMLERGHKLRVGQEGIVGRVAGAAEPRIALDVGDDFVHFKNPLLPGTRSEMALPLRVDEHVIGVLDVQSNRESAFDEEDLAALQVLADQLAVAIERVRLFEQTRAALEQRLHAIVSNAPVILFAADGEGTITLLEGKGLESTGLEPGDTVGQSIFELVEDVPQISDHIRRALAGEELISLEEIGDLAFEIGYAPLRDESGQIVGAIGVATDVTERRKLEMQMQRQERLAAIGQLAGGIAHDFNNMLTTIMLYAQMPLGKTLPPEMTRALETILSESRRAAELVQQILDFSRRSPIKTRPLDLDPLVKEASRILQRTIPESIRLHLDTGAGAYVVSADATRIQQVLMNLVVNARDAMPEGGDLQIGLSQVVVAERESPPVMGMQAGEWVCFSVSDTGTGIPPNVLPHIFEPFFTTKGSQGGTGLGLPQVYGIVTQHGGQVGVETEVGKGTVFRVYLPTCQAEEEGTSRPEATSGSLAGMGETILLVEDGQTILEAGREILESLGYRVLTATNGREALAIYQAEQVDLVITDLVMPDMGGRELVRELRKVDSSLEALAVTGYAMGEDAKGLHEAGFLGTVQKPFDADTLAQAVRRALDGE